MSWPLSRRRSVIPLPIRPSPIIPSCMCTKLLRLAVFDVDASRAAAALLQRRVVARRLCADEPAEAERLAGDGELVALVVDHLQKQAGVRAALVELARRMQVARPVAVSHHQPAATAQLAYEVFDTHVVLRRGLD